MARLRCVLPTPVATDDVISELTEMNISDARVVIHFDPPTKHYVDSSKRRKRRQWTMGKRLWCMRRHFLNPVREKTVWP